ncbi:MAG TPA: hypothetical protein VNW95_16525 [Mucilaginibacter sp.]|jgi:hypothetical protein|nr:hypothetical protein [Mucilaginibacter sp.]
MKYIFVFLFNLLFLSSYAQTKQDNLYNTWVLRKITYKDGSSLPDENPLKFAYMKYTFGYPDRFNFSSVYFEKGIQRSFELKGDYLQLKSPEGTVINTQKIEELGNEKLILLQAGREGFNDPTSLLFNFVPENIYQESIKLRPSDIQSVYHGDTTYVESPKIYASYNGESFQRFVYNEIENHINMHDKVGHFVATFVVSQAGVADSLELLENIDADFDKRFVKIFNQAKRSWKPAALNGKYVNVLMKLDLRYSTSATTLPAYFAGQKAIEAYNNKDYKAAEYFYEQALESEPVDKEFHYRLGMCKMLLGNMSGACEEWNKAKALGSTTSIDAVIEKFCK